MRNPPLVPLLVLLSLPFELCAAPIHPEIADLSFGSQLEAPGALRAAKVPAWITKVEHHGGRYVEEPRSWQVAASESIGVGRLSLSLDRERMKDDLVLTVLFEAGESADVAVQLFDAQGRVVEVDLFGNLVAVSQEATTDTFIIPLRKYPTAEKIVLRRISGDVKIYGVVLYPAVTDGTPNEQALRKLASVLGDPLSPENPLAKGIQQVARSSKLVLETPKPAAPLTAPALLETVPAGKATPAPLLRYPGAVPPVAGTPVPPIPADGLIGYWNFDHADATDTSGHGHDGLVRGGASFAAGLHGQGLHLRKNPSSARAVSWDSVTMAPGADFTGASMTVSAWVKYSSIAPNWGSQIAWFGDSQFGRDPWQLHLYPDGTLSLRSDRSVTGKPVFTVFGDEIQLSAKGVPMPNQHVSIWSPKKLAAETWYFVAGTIEKTSPQRSTLTLFVNGEMVDQVQTREVVDYPTGKMWMTIGAVDTGTWQNFDGTLDEVRVYKRPLTAAEIKALYNQPW